MSGMTRFFGPTVTGVLNDCGVRLSLTSKKVTNQQKTYELPDNSAANNLGLDNIDQPGRQNKSRAGLSQP
ncbi:hypothetical protein GCM10009094_28830 [Massilia aurea]